MLMWFPPTVSYWQELRLREWMGDFSPGQEMYHMGQTILALPGNKAAIKDNSKGYEATWIGKDGTIKHEYRE